MSYQIEYGSFRYDPNKKQIRKGKLLLGILAIIMAVIILLQFPTEINHFRQAILPFFEPEVQRAFGEMVELIDDGENLSDAATAFCKEIIFEEL